MTLGDIFDKLFKLIGRTWLQNLILALVILAVPLVILAFSVNGLLSGIVSMAEEQNNGAEVGIGGLFAILGQLALFGIGLVIFMLGTVAARLGITTITCAEMAGEPVDWRQALTRALGVRYARLLGAEILMILAIGGMVGIPYALLIVSIAVRSITLGLVAGFMLVVFGCLGVYIAIRWSFLVPVIAWEDAGVTAAFRRSWALVRDQWWRVFGIVLLLGIVTSFAVSLVLAPVYIATFLSFFSSMFRHAGDFHAEQTDPRIFLEGFRTFGFGIGVLSGLSSLLQLLIAPLYIVVLYFDLRARKGEFSAPATTGGPVL